MPRRPDPQTRLISLGDRHIDLPNVQEALHEAGIQHGAFQNSPNAAPPAALIPSAMFGGIGYLEERRLPADQRITEYNRLMVSLSRANTCCSVCGGNGQSQSSAYYTVAYMTKNPTKITNTMALFSAALRHSRAFPSRAADAGTLDRAAIYTLTIVLNMLAGAREIPAPLVALTLLGAPAEYKSHQGTFVFVSKIIDAVSDRRRRSADPTCPCCRNVACDVTNNIDNLRFDSDVDFIAIDFAMRPAPVSLACHPHRGTTLIVVEQTSANDHPELHEGDMLLMLNHDLLSGTTVQGLLRTFAAARPRMVYVARQRQHAPPQLHHSHAMLDGAAHQPASEPLPVLSNVPQVPLGAAEQNDRRHSLNAPSVAAEPCPVCLTLAPCSHAAVIQQLRLQPHQNIVNIQLVPGQLHATVDTRVHPGGLQFLVIARVDLPVQSLSVNDRLLFFNGISLVNATLDDLDLLLAVDGPRNICIVRNDVRQPPAAGAFDAFDATANVCPVCQISGCDHCEALHQLLRPPQSVFVRIRVQPGPLCVTLCPVGQQLLHTVTALLPGPRTGFCVGDELVFADGQLLLGHPDVEIERGQTVTVLRRNGLPNQHGTALPERLSFRFCNGMFVAYDEDYRYRPLPYMPCNLYEFVATTTVVDIPTGSPTLVPPDQPLPPRRPGAYIGGWDKFQIDHTMHDQKCVKILRSLRLPMLSGRTTPSLDDRCIPALLGHEPYIEPAAAADRRKRKRWALYFAHLLVQWNIAGFVPLRYCSAAGFVGLLARWRLGTYIQRCRFTLCMRLSFSKLSTATKRRIMQHRSEYADVLPQVLRNGNVNAVDAGRQRADGAQPASDNGGPPPGDGARNDDDENNEPDADAGRQARDGLGLEEAILHAATNVDDERMRATRNHMAHLEHSIRQHVHLDSVNPNGSSVPVQIPPLYGEEWGRAVIAGLQPEDTAAAQPPVVPGASVQPTPFLQQPQIQALLAEVPYRRLSDLQERIIQSIVDGTLGGEQFLAFVNGMAGSGKTALIRQLFRRLLIAHEVAPRCSAVTGIAAKDMPLGTTCASLFKLPIQTAERHLSADALIALAVNIGPDTVVLIIDEVSFLSAEQLATLSRNLRLAFPERGDQPYAGFHVVLVGDMGQLQPPAGTSLDNALVSLTHRRHLHRNNGFRTVTYDNLCDAGADLFSRHVRYVLDQQMRSVDSTHTAMVRRLWDASMQDDPITTDDINNIQDFSADLLHQDPQFHDATFVVATNQERSVITRQLAIAQARRRNTVVYSWLCPLVQDRECEGAECLGARALEHTGYSRIRRYYVEGCRAYITDNISVERRITNGSVGTFAGLIAPALPNPSNYRPGDIVNIDQPIAIVVRVDGVNIPCFQSRKRDRWLRQNIKYNGLKAELGLAVTYHRSDHG